MVQQIARTLARDLKAVAKHGARRVRDDVLPRERLRRANPQASIAATVVVGGDASRIHLGDQVTISNYTVLFATNGGNLDRARLEIGDRTYIGEFNNIRCAGVPVVIGRDCLISQHVNIVGSNHETAADAPINQQGWTGTGVTIGNDVWIGAGACITAGVTIGDGAVVGANAVVTKEVEANAVVVGIPARQVSTRS